MSFLKDLLFSGNQIPEYLEKDAAIIDVRSEMEFRQGHIKGSKNIPLDRLSSHKDKLLNLGKPVIFCCASGARSGRAASKMKSEGLDCINGGGWSGLNQKIKK